MLIEAVKADDGILIHLATEEFEHLFDWKRVKEEVKVIQPLFYVDKGDTIKVVSVHAKSCRGAMTRYIIQNRLTQPSDILGFELGVFGEKKMCGRVSMGVFRTTFIADETGTITRIIGPKEIKVKEHATQILG